MQRGLGGFPHERLHQDNVVCTKLGVKTEAEILPKYPQTYFSLGRLDMARGPRHPILRSCSANDRFFKFFSGKWQSLCYT